MSSTDSSAFGEAGAGLDGGGLGGGGGGGRAEVSLLALLLPPLPGDSSELASPDSRNSTNSSPTDSPSSASSSSKLFSRRALPLPDADAARFWHSREVAGGVVRERVSSGHAECKRVTQRASIFDSSASRSRKKSPKP